MGSDKTNEDLSKHVKQDLKLSVLSGPLTVIIPVLSYIFLYPIILSRSSIEVLGLWSLYVTTASFFTVADIGFSQHFVREASKDQSPNILRILKEELLSARRFYLLLGLVGVIILLVFNKVIFVSSEKIYPPSGLLISAIILIISGTIQLISSLDAAILSARADNYYVRLIRSISSIFTYSIAVCGALLDLPIEGFSVGFFISNNFLILVYHRRFKIKHKDWHSVNISAPFKQSLKDLKNLLQKSLQLYSVSIGMLIRQPVVRYVVAISLGLSATGVFDIAMRVTTTLREIAANGFSTLFPFFSYFYRRNDKRKIINVIRTSLIILIPVGFISTIIFIFYSEFIYSIWLKEIPPGAVLATIVLAIWQLITLINVPFWHLLLASHNEKIAAISIWAHTLSILLIIPLKLIGIEFALYSLLIYWTATSLLTQLLIYISVERKLSLLWIVFKSKQIISIIIINVIYFILTMFTGRLIETEIGIPHPEKLALTVLFLITLAPFYIKLLKQNVPLKKI
jgi:O-antigen/teichoic acid export membrane protein